MMSEKQIRELRKDIIEEHQYQWVEYMRENAKNPHSEESKNRYILHRDEGIRIQLIDQILNGTEE